jgi:hypothetical protein
MLARDATPVADFATVKTAARGRWQTILPALGVDTRYLSSGHGACPGCGGSDRFRFDDRDGCGSFFCSGGGSKDTFGDGFELLQHAGIAQSPAEALSLVARHLDISGARSRSTAPAAPSRATVFDYRDADGVVRFTVTRVDGEGGKSFSQKTARGLPPSKDPTHRWLPYRLPEMLARPDATVHIVEGEKCADALAALGLVATTNAGGATNWQPELNERFAGRHVVVLPDNDARGEAHFERVRDQLLDLVASMRVCRLSGLPDKGDVIDWLGLGNGLKDLMMELEGAVVVDDGLGMAPSQIKKLVVVERQPISRFFQSGITLIAGEPKAGKSTFCEQEAKEIARDHMVVYLAMEYQDADLLSRFGDVPDSSKLRVFRQGEVPRFDAGGREFLDRVLKRLKPHVVFVDVLADLKPLSAKDGYEGENAALKEIKQFFDGHGTSAVVIHHTRKRGVNDREGDPFERILGSTALASVPDTLMVLEDATNEGAPHKLWTKGRSVRRSVQRLMLDQDQMRFSLMENPGASLLGTADVQARILDFLVRGRSRQKDIAVGLGLHGSHVSSYVKKLAARGLVVKHSDGSVELFGGEELF